MLNPSSIHCAWRAMTHQNQFGKRNPLRAPHLLKRATKELELEHPEMELERQALAGEALRPRRRPRLLPLRPPPPSTAASRRRVLLRLSGSIETWRVRCMAHSHQNRCWSGGLMSILMVSSQSRWRGRRSGGGSTHRHSHSAESSKPTARSS